MKANIDYIRNGIAENIRRMKIGDVEVSDVNSVIFVTEVNFVRTIFVTVSDFNEDHGLAKVNIIVPDIYMFDKNKNDGNEEIRILRIINNLNSNIVIGKVSLQEDEETNQWSVSAEIGMLSKHKDILQESYMKCAIDSLILVCSKTQRDIHLEGILSSVGNLGFMGIDEIDNERRR